MQTRTGKHKYTDTVHVPYTLLSLVTSKYERIQVIGGTFFIILVYITMLALHIIYIIAL